MRSVTESLMLRVCAGMTLTKLSTHSLVRRFVAPGAYPRRWSPSGATRVYTRAKRDSLTFQAPGDRLVVGKACVISAVALVGPVTAMILARPLAFPMISPRTWALENTPELVVKVAIAPSVPAVAGTVSVALGAVGAG